MIKLILKNSQIDKAQSVNLKTHCGEICDDCRGKGNNAKDRECASCNSKGII